jgi:hypothetical protein
MLTANFKRHADRDSLRRVTIKTLESTLPWLAGDSIEQPIAARAVPPVDTPNRPLRMVNIATETGLRFQYENAEPRKDRDFLIYEQFGGGVAVLDYDLDGRVDLYFGQPAGAPLQSNGVKPNYLYRQLDPEYSLVTTESRADDRGYSLGVSAGDLNQDGFDDIVVCNFGVNTRLINQGDGTFRRADPDEAWQHAIWTSSVAIGDVNHDGLPDVVEVNYLDDPEMVEIPPLDAQGRRIPSRGPASYHPASDRVLLQQAEGDWKAVSLETSEDPSAPGLGVVLANIDRNNGLDFVVANDTRPNQLWLSHKEDSHHPPI